MEHISVLIKESIESLNIKKDGIYVDLTLGGGGHSFEILKKLSKKGHLYCFDCDSYSIMRGTEKLKELKKDNFTIIKSNYEYMKEELHLLGVDYVDGIIADLGCSSFQLDEGERGFSYRVDAPLDMRMDKDLKITAKDIINSYSYKDLADVLYKYGDEKFSFSIAKKICEAREKKQVETTFELVDIIKSALPAKELSKKGHPAKKTFQALRIEVNHEMDALAKAMDDAVSILAKGGRISVIDFQPLEDKIVKNTFKKYYTVPYVKGLPIQADPILKRITKKPIEPETSEIDSNYRSHSALLRVVEKL